MTAFLTAAPQHIAPSGCPHANAKAVCFCPAPAIRLKSTFQSAMLPAWISSLNFDYLR